jgi:hypothetical protein
MPKKSKTATKKAAKKPAPAAADSSSSRRSKRSRGDGVVSYAESSLAAAFDIKGGGEPEGGGKRGKTGAAASASSSSSYKPPPAVDAEDVDEDVQPVPAKNKAGELVFKDHPEFRPNLTPAEVLQRGSFGGTYFRRITSSVTGEAYTGAHKEFPKVRSPVTHGGRPPVNSCGSARGVWVGCELVCSRRTAWWW